MAKWREEKCMNSSGEMKASGYDNLLIMNECKNQHIAMLKCTKASSNLSAVLSALLICAFVLHIKIINIFNISFYFLFSFDYFWMNRLELQQVVDQLMNRRWICNYFDNRLIVIFKQKFGYISLHCSKFTCWHFELL